MGECHELTGNREPKTRRPLGHGTFAEHATGHRLKGQATTTEDVTSPALGERNPLHAQSGNRIDCAGARLAHREAVERQA